MHPFDIVSSSDFSLRADESLTAFLEQRKSVAFIGMKRVGINAFLRQYLRRRKNEGVLRVGAAHTAPRPPLLIPIDLNNLVERNLYALWTLTLKTLLDSVHEHLENQSVREQSEALFTQSIQLRDVFFATHAVQRLLDHLSENGRPVTLFFLRFDRLQQVITNEFIFNLHGLKDRLPSLSYVVTSYRPLHELVPHVFPQSSAQSFFAQQFILPLNQEEQESFLPRLHKAHEVSCSPQVMQELKRLCGGHVQYLQLATLHLKNTPDLWEEAARLETSLRTDENIMLLSEEIFTSLTADEQKYLKNLSQSNELAPDYLQQSGILNAQGDIFSPLFFWSIHHSMRTNKKDLSEFTKKEQRFFDCLLGEKGNLVTRNAIIEAVWQEESELGVSDWAVDRLAARVRRKLLAQRSPYQLQTVVSRGYKLLSIVSSQDDTLAHHDE